MPIEILYKYTSSQLFVYQMMILIHKRKHNGNEELPLREMTRREKRNIMLSSFSG